MASKKRKRAGTLLERHGFKHPDAGTPVHDGICAWLDKNMAEVCGELFPQHKGTITVEEKIWEKPIHKDERKSSAVVGFADIAVKVLHRQAWRVVDDSVKEWACKPSNNCCTVEMKDWSLDGMTSTCFEPWHMLGNKKSKNCRVRVKTPADIRTTDKIVPEVFASVIFEAKSAIPSLGDILRELQFYKEHTTSSTKLVVVCHDDTHAPTIREQGFLFYKCPDLRPLAKISNDRGIGRFFSARASKRKRACHPDSIVVRTEAGATRVCIYGICPKCATGSGYLDVPAEHVHNLSGPHTSSLTVDKCSIETTCGLETCEHRYRVHV
jgi:hypothetical protein